MTRALHAMFTESPFMTRQQRRSGVRRHGSSSRCANCTLAAGSKEVQQRGSGGAEGGITLRWRRVLVCADATFVQRQCATHHTPQAAAAAAAAAPVGMHRQPPPNTTVCRAVTGAVATPGYHTRAADLTSHVTRHTSHLTRHTSHVTRHTSHVTRHTSHVTSANDLLEKGCVPVMSSYRTTPKLHMSVAEVYLMT